MKELKVKSKKKLTKKVLGDKEYEEGKITQIQKRHIQQTKTQETVKLNIGCLVNQSQMMKKERGKKTFKEGLRAGLQEDEKKMK